METQSSVKISANARAQSTNISNTSSKRVYDIFSPGKWEHLTSKVLTLKPA